MKNIKVGKCNSSRQILNRVTALISEQFSESWLDDSSLAKLGKRILQKAEVVLKSCNTHISSHSRGLRGVSEVYQGLKELPGIYNKRVAFCKIYFPYFARDKWSDHDFKNCSEIRRVTRIRKTWVQSQILRQWLEIKALQGSKTTSAFCKIRLPNFAQDESSNHDSKNCSEISAVTWFRICPVLLHFPTFMFFTPPYCP